MKILIIAFPRSGTSMTNRIFNNHLDIEKMFFETLYMYRFKTGRTVKTESSILFDKHTNSGEKIIYEKLNIGKHKGTPLYTDYVDWWNDYFGVDNAKIIQVMRHPYDVWNSIILNKYIKRNAIGNINKNLIKYFECVPKYMKYIDKLDNSYSFKLEDFIDNSDVVLNELYEHCGLDINRTSFKERPKSNKLFSYQNKGFVIDKDKRLEEYRKEFWSIMDNGIMNVIDYMNDTFRGPTYKK